jgi:hypothetical protein
MASAIIQPTPEGCNYRNPIVHQGENGFMSPLRDDL